MASATNPFIQVNNNYGALQVMNTGGNGGGGGLSLQDVAQLTALRSNVNVTLAHSQIPAGLLIGEMDKLLLFVNTLRANDKIIGQRQMQEIERLRELVGKREEQNESMRQLIANLKTKMALEMQTRQQKEKKPAQTGSKGKGKSLAAAATTTSTSNKKIVDAEEEEEDQDKMDIDENPAAAVHHQQQQQQQREEEEDEDKDDENVDEDEDAVVYVRGNGADRIVAMRAWDEVLEQADYDLMKSNAAFRTDRVDRIYRSTNAWQVSAFLKRILVRRILHFSAPLIRDWLSRATTTPDVVSSFTKGLLAFDAAGAKARLTIAAQTIAKVVEDARDVSDDQNDWIAAINAEILTFSETDTDEFAKFVVHVLQHFRKFEADLYESSASSSLSAPPPPLTRQPATARLPIPTSIPKKPAALKKKAAIQSNPASPSHSPSSASPPLAPATAANNNNNNSNNSKQQRPQHGGGGARGKGQDLSPDQAIRSDNLRLRQTGFDYVALDDACDYRAAMKGEDFPETNNLSVYSLDGDRSNRNRAVWRKWNPFLRRVAVRRIILNVTEAVFEHLYTLDDKLVREFNQGKHSLPSTRPSRKQCLQRPEIEDASGDMLFVDAEAIQGRLGTTADEMAALQRILDGWADHTPGPFEDFYDTVIKNFRTFENGPNGAASPYDDSSNLKLKTRIFVQNPDGWCPEAAAGVWAGAGAGAGGGEDNDEEGGEGSEPRILNQVDWVAEDLKLPAQTLAGERPTAEVLAQDYDFSDIRNPTKWQIPPENQLGMEDKCWYCGKTLFPPYGATVRCAHRTPVSGHPDATIQCHRFAHPQCVSTQLNSLLLDLGEAFYDKEELMAQVLCPYHRFDPAVYFGKIKNAANKS